MTCVQDCQREAELERRIAELEAVIRMYLADCDNAECQFCEAARKALNN